MSLYGTDYWGWAPHFAPAAVVYPKSIEYISTLPKPWNNILDISLEPASTTGRILHRRREFIPQKERRNVHYEQHGTREFAREQALKTYPQLHQVLSQNPMVEQIFDPYVTKNQKERIIRGDPQLTNYPDLLEFVEQFYI